MASDDEDDIFVAALEAAESKLLQPVAISSHTVSSSQFMQS
jgi:hypothetical protein